MNNLAITTQESALPVLFQQSNISEKIDAFQLMKYNKKKYNDYLTNAREDRTKKKEKAYLDSKSRQIEEKIKSYQPKTNMAKEEEDVNIRPLDLGALYNENKDGLDSPRVEIPAKPDTLFVTKPISTYEPYDVTTTGQKFVPDQNTVFKEFPMHPSSHSEVRDCNLDLTGEQLQKIQVGPTNIDFKSIFMKSKVSQYFQVKNELRNSIMVRVSAPFPELEGSYQNPQIIPSGKIAGFKIELSSHEQQVFNQTISYIINDKHHFKLKVIADIIPVNLMLSKTYLKFMFNDDTLDMVTSEKIQIENRGNAKGYFKWLTSENSVFKITPISGKVNPRSSITCNITFCPSGQK
jgi:hypothetical protein